MKILNFKDFSILESLPRQQTVDQLKKLRKLTKGIDIGDRISDLNKQGANIQYYRNTIDSGIESYEDFEKNNKKFVSSWNLKGMMSPFSKSKGSNKMNESHNDESTIRDPTNPIRKELESYLNDILLELKDLGYGPQIKGFIKTDYTSKPYIWIENHRRLTHNEFWDEINDIVDRIKDYLEYEGFSTDVEIINKGRTSEQVYIFFDKIKSTLNENKMWYKSIPEILEWLESKSKVPFIWCDTETTGLGGPKKQQLTQVSAIATQYDFHSNNFSEIGTFDEKIKLTDDTKSKFLQPEDKTKWVLSFNHYGSGDYKYKNESDIVEDFFKWISNYSPNILVAQNASFDMAMLSGRYGHKIESEVFDTKMLIQLYFLPLLQKLSETDSKYKEMIDFIGTSTRDNGLISSSMSKIGPVLGINMIGYHDAITDCRITIQMYQKIIEILKQNKDVDITKYQIERIKNLK
jgi:hypothetical protein